MANTIYTLRGENVGPLKHLNGKMFTIEFDSEDHMTLNDVTTGNWLRKTTHVVKSEETINGVVYTTASGTVYDLIDVATLLPSNVNCDNSSDNIELPFETVPIVAVEIPVEIPVEVQEKAAKVAEEAIKEADTEEAINIDDIPAVVEEYNINRAIYYGDGYYGVVFSFTGEVNYEQFIRFCKAKGMKVPREKGYAWYEDHPMVFNHRINDGEYCPNKGASSKDTSHVWTWLWVRAYTD